MLLRMNEYFTFQFANQKKTKTKSNNTTKQKIQKGERDAVVIKTRKI